MGLSIEKVSETSHSVVLQENVWLTADRSKAVPEGDADAAFLLGTAGKRITVAEAERLGLMASGVGVDDGRPAKSASRAEWDEYAESVGLDPAEFSSKDALIEAVEAQG